MSHIQTITVPSQRVKPENLGPLQDLPGTWQGTGFSLIARPDFSGGNPAGFFLELNPLLENFECTVMGSPVRNRGSVQGDITSYGVTYMHRATDAATGEALHIEPGLFLNIPATTEPKADASVARLAAIPHGNAVCAVGFATDVTFDGLPDIPPANTVPFPAGSQPPPPGTKNPYQAYNLSVPTRFRTAPVPAGITQDVINDPNAWLRHAYRQQAAEGHAMLSATWLITSTAQAGGIGNIPFIVSNANPLSLESVFSIETVRSPAGTEYLQLGYSQTTLLNFRGLSFPHVTVGTLMKVS
jgi:hypothetical protein